jgi:hypothetical protein
VYHGFVTYASFLFILCTVFTVPLFFVCLLFPSFAKTGTIFRGNHGGHGKVAIYLPPHFVHPSSEETRVFRHEIKLTDFPERSAHIIQSTYFGINVMKSIQSRL